jgi:flotillin
MFSFLFSSLPIFILVVALVGGLIVFMVSGYVKASPDEALIISGLHSKPRVLTGRSGFKVPYFERVDYLCLKQISVDIKTDQFIPTNDFINVKVDAVAKVHVTDDPDGMLLAERNFLNMKEDEIASSLQDSLQGNMREIIGTLTLKSINTDRDSFSDQVMAKASKDMEKLGIEILSCNIQNVTDEHGLITDLGMDNTEQIRKDASIAKARARKEVAIAEAEAERESNEVRVEADREIAEKQQALAIQRAQLKTEQDTEQAKADAAYEIQQQEQQRTVLEAETRAKAESVRVREQELAAEVKKRAEADKYQAIQAAEAAMEAEKRRAEAAVYAAEQEAKATKLRGEAEAEAIRAKGVAEAEAIRAKGEAEAAALEKRAEALQKMNQAGMAEMMIKVLPEVAAAVAQPLSSIDNVSVYDSGANGGETGISRISGAMPVVIRQVFDTMSDATGVDMREVMRANTYDATVNRNITLDGSLKEE